MTILESGGRSGLPPDPGTRARFAIRRKAHAFRYNVEPCSFARLRGAAAHCVVAQMPSLRQLERHCPLLVLDAASSLVQVGMVNADGGGRWATSSDEAGVAIFACIEQLGVDVNTVPGFAFCDGPGSVLGIRTASMALRAWRVLEPRPVFAYSSLAVVAHALGREEVGVIADARRDAWHHYQIGVGLRRVPATELNGSAGLVTPEHFRNWTPLPANVTRIPYSLAELLPKVADADLFLETDAPDAFLHEEPSYVTWTPQIHRAPGERA